MNPVKIIFLPTEPTQKKGVFDMNHSSVDGYLLAEDLEKQINDFTEIGYVFLRMEPITGVKTMSGAPSQTTIGYLLFFEKVSGN